MAIWQFDFWIVPKNRSKKSFRDEEIMSWQKDKFNVDANELLNEILKKEKSWSESIEQYGKTDETCIQFNKENGKVDEISCRLDLRALTINELDKILKYVLIIGGNIFYHKEIYPPEIEIIKSLMRKSSAAKYCANPQQYFETQVVPIEEDEVK